MGGLPPLLAFEAATLDAFSQSEKANIFVATCLSFPIFWVQFEMPG